jgi:hypothetical protein
MSTLFRRLAAQRLGTPNPRIRPLASLPYQSAHAFIDTPMTDEITTPVIAPDPAAHPTPRTDTGHTSVEVRPDATAQAPDAAIDETPVKRRAKPPQATAMPPHVPEIIPTRPALQRDGAQPSANRQAASPASGTELDTPHQHEIDDTRTGAFPGPAPRRDAPPPSPNPLIPAFRPRATSTPSAQQRPGPQASSGQIDHTAVTAPDEIHVHIGRIEVTAVQEAPKPKAREQRGQAPMSLDDYLAKRQRGGA